MTKDDVLGQPLREDSKNAPPGVDINRLNRTVVDGGNATTNETWLQTLQRGLANRDFTSAICS